MTSSCQSVQILIEDSHQPKQWLRVFQFFNFDDLVYKNGYESGVFILQTSAYDSWEAPCVRNSSDIV